MCTMIDVKDLYQWCSIPADGLPGHAGLRTPFRMVADSAAMGELMASDFVEEIERANTEERMIRAIVPCGPKSWYQPFVRLVNERKVNLARLFVFHMDECLDWQGRLLAGNDPYNFRTFMERHFYSGINPDLEVPRSQRFFLDPANMARIQEEIWRAPVDITLGGWGQDGHIAYNQARRHPSVTLRSISSGAVRSGFRRTAWIQ